jgi:hypothetical protein
VQEIVVTVARFPTRFLSTTTMVYTVHWWFTVCLWGRRHIRPHMQGAEQCLKVAGTRLGGQVQQCLQEETSTLLAMRPTLSATTGMVAIAVRTNRSSSLQSHLL